MNNFCRLALACLTVLGCAVSRLPDPSAAQKGRDLPPPLMEGIGRSELFVTTRSELAQQYFNQGLSLMHGYWYFEAWRAFQHAARLDSSCAMAYWGIYQALGGDSGLRKEALSKARVLSSGASEAEQRYIGAAVLLDSMGYAAGRQPYIRAMQELIDRYPDDVEARLFLIRFLMPGYDPDDPPRKEEPDPKEMLAELLESHPDHIAVHHYWIHVVEPGDHPEQALPSAEKLPHLAPGIGHLVHMPGHIYYLLGDYDKARRAFIAAHQVDSTYMAEQQIPPAKTWNYIHNLNFMVANCAEDGRYGDGVRWAKKLGQIPLDLNRSIIFYQGRTALARLQLRYGLWGEAAVSLAPLVQNDTLRSSFGRHFAEGLLAYARGLEALARGQVDSARKQAKVLKDFGWVFTIQPPDPEDGFYSQRHVDFLNVLSLDLQGNIHSAAGEHERAIELLEEARVVENTLGYQEPPASVRPVIESIGEAYLRAGDGNAALAVFEQLLQRRPRSGHALFGIARACALAGRSAGVVAYREFLQTWAHADPDLPQVRQAQEWLAKQEE